MDMCKHCVKGETTEGDGLFGDTRNEPLESGVDADDVRCGFALLACGLEGPHI